jgi:hypothetical protein
MNKYPIGKGIFIWRLDQCAGGDPIKLASMAKAAGFSWVVIKAADGTDDFNQGTTYWGGPNLLQKAIRALWDAHIQVWGWQYIYGANKLGISLAYREAVKAHENILRFGLDGWILDPEGKYKRKGANVWADTYMTTLRASHPDLPIGLCSYRYPAYHPELPWQSFLRRCDFHAPQVYWLQAHNPGFQLRESYKQLMALKSMPFVPVGAAYYDTSFKWGPTVAEINEFNTVSQELKCPGIFWWEWGEYGQGAEYHPDWWQAISNHDWGTIPAPPLTLEERVKRLEDKVFGV